MKHLGVWMGMGSTGGAGLPLQQVWGCPEAVSVHPSIHPPSAKTSEQKSGEKAKPRIPSSGQDPPAPRQSALSHPAGARGKGDLCSHLRGTGRSTAGTGPPLSPQPPGVTRSMETPQCHSRWHQQQSASPAGLHDSSCPALCRMVTATPSLGLGWEPAWAHWEGFLQLQGCKQGQ